MKEQGVTRIGRGVPSLAGWIVFGLGGFVLYSVYLGFAFWLGLTYRWVRSWDDLVWVLQVVQFVGIVLVTAVLGTLFRLRTRRGWARGFVLMVVILYVVPVALPSLFAH